MNNQNLINKIEYQANKFKQRAHKGPGDEKRHDPIQPDEQECIWIAHKKLGWSVAKIGSIFDRDPRTVSKYITKANDKHQLKTKHQQEEQKQVLTDKQAQHVKHLQELARTTIDTCPDIPNPDKVDEFEGKFLALCEVYLRLRGDSFWSALKTHLGIMGKELEQMSYKLETLMETMPLPWFNKAKVPDEYVQLYMDGLDLIKGSSLVLIARSGDTREWENNGLKQRCPLCPFQDYEPVE